MPSGKATKPFDYMFTTASNTVCIDFPSIMTAVEMKPRNAVLGENLPLCGFGFGLATSKLVSCFSLLAGWNWIENFIICTPGA